MGYNLRNRHFLKFLDFEEREIRYLLDLARDLKRAKYMGTETPRLSGKNIALIFEKSSTRTRCAFEVAAADQGAYTTYLGPTGSQIGAKESMADTARVLGRMYDAIEYRGFGQDKVETLAQYSGVPVYNGLTNEFHPTQILADFLTMEEHSQKRLSQVAYTFIGDAKNNMGHSFLIGGAIMGMDVRICGPKTYFPESSLIEKAKKIAEKTGARILVTEDTHKAVLGTDFICTDVWVSMGEDPKVWAQRIKELHPYQVNRGLLATSGNKDVKFMHCLPAFHDCKTKVGEEIYKKFGLESMEVTDEIFESKASIVFDEAENRLHTIKAIMVATLGG